MMDKSIVDKTFNKHTNYQEAESINSKAEKGVQYNYMEL